MGGDFAPEQTVLGAIQARMELPETFQLVLIGDKNAILPILKREHADESKFIIEHCTEVIGMAEHPTKAIQQKPDSSISKGFQLLKEKSIDAFASAGNTGRSRCGHREHQRRLRRERQRRHADRHDADRPRHADGAAGADDLRQGSERHVLPLARRHPDGVRLLVGCPGDGDGAQDPLRHPEPEGLGRAFPVGGHLRRDVHP